MADVAGTGHRAERACHLLLSGTRRPAPCDPSLQLAALRSLLALLLLLVARLLLRNQRGAVLFPLEIPEGPVPEELPGVAGPDPGAERPQPLVPKQRLQAAPGGDGGIVRVLRTPAV